MSSNEKTIYVYDDFSYDTPVLLGRLYVDVIKGSESYAFEYDDRWLKNTMLSVNLDPCLLPFGGRQYPSGKGIFGLFADASPDRWGRILMTKKERILADKEDRKQLLLIPRAIYGLQSFRPAMTITTQVLGKR